VGHGTVNMASVYFVREIISLLSHSLKSPPVPKFQPAVYASTLSLELRNTHFHFFTKAQRYRLKIY
jgi:hypothetical protein